MKTLKYLGALLITIATVLPTNLLANWSNYPFYPAPWVHGGNWRGPDFMWDLIAQLFPYI